MMIAEELIAAKREELHGIVDELLGIVSESVEEQVPIHKVELKAFRKLLRAGHTIVQLLVDCQGDGDVGETCDLADGTTVTRSKEPHARPYVSIFGPLHFYNRDGLPAAPFTTYDSLKYELELSSGASE